MEKQVFKIRRTHIAEVRCTNETQIAEVRRVLGWTEERYCWHQYREYERFVNTLATAYPELKVWIRYSAVFRGFWNNEWAMRNKVHFLPWAYDLRDDHQAIKEEYLHVHSHMRLIHDDEFYNKFENLLKLI